MASNVQLPLFIATLDHWYDDYKRAEGYSEKIGIFTTELQAYRAVWKAEILKNAEGRDFENAKDSAYLAWYKKLDSFTTDEEVEAVRAKIEEDREEYLGRGEFTMKSSGYRFQIEKVTEVNPDPMVADKKLRKLERELFDEMDPEAAEKRLKEEEEEEPTGKEEEEEE